MILSETALAIGGAVLLAAPASGVTVSSSDPFITVRATSSAGTGIYTVPLSSVFDAHDPETDFWQFTFSGSTAITSGSNVIASVLGLTVTAGRSTDSNGEETIGWSMGFNVQAGASDTTFQIMSPRLSFSPVQGASGLTSAGIVVADNFGSNGATAWPTAPNGFTYNTMFNGASVFRSFLGPVVAAVDDSNGAEGNMLPAGVFQPIGTVTNMASSYEFGLTAGDSAGGSSQFSLIPGPSSIALVGLGGLALGRRRR